MEKVIWCEGYLENQNWLLQFLVALTSLKIKIECIFGLLIKIVAHKILPSGKIVTITIKRASKT